VRAPRAHANKQAGRKKQKQNEERKKQTRKQKTKKENLKAISQRFTKRFTRLKSEQKRLSTNQQKSVRQFADRGRVLGREKGLRTLSPSLIKKTKKLKKNFFA